MKKLTALLAMLAASGASQKALATELEDEALRCASLENDIERLACFDDAVAGKLSDVATEAADGDCAAISMTDLKLDLQTLAGECVRVSANVMVMGDMVMLGSGAIDPNPVVASQNELSRSDRKKLLQCGMGCSMEMRGRVGTVMFQPGVVLEDIITP